MGQCENVSHLGVSIVKVCVLGRGGRKIGRGGMSVVYCMHDCCISVSMLCVYMCWSMCLYSVYVCVYVFVCVLCVCVYYVCVNCVCVCVCVCVCLSNVLIC